ncbi:MAG TPA: hydrogenase maturation nickel metallochaperone HypA [Holophaga sp.]|jgi:hydrogenase nickel incorporation protein HypA/HybF|nr:hydrogenase maturation nickel metallochaperone HypA [Holophaga sp.]
MHEVALMEELLRIVQEEARLAGGGRARRVCLEVGALAGVDPDALRFAFEALAPERLGSACLDLVESPGRAWCEACRAEVALAIRFDPCPRCGAFPLTLTGGSELILKELELEEAPCATPADVKRAANPAAAACALDA